MIFQYKNGVLAVGKKGKRIDDHRGKQRQHEAFWHQEAYGRCCLYLTAPKAELRPGKSPGFKTDVGGYSLRSPLGTAGPRKTPCCWVTPSPRYLPILVRAALPPASEGTTISGRNLPWFEKRTVFYSGLGKSAGARTESAVCYVNRLVEEYSNALLQAGKGKFYTPPSQISAGPMTWLPLCGELQNLFDRPV